LGNTVKYKYYDSLADKHNMGEMFMLEPLRIAICESAPGSMEKLQMLIQHCALRTTLSFYSGGEQLLSHYRCGAFDLILID
jgi:hypothetical protein